MLALYIRTCIHQSFHCIIYGKCNEKFTKFCLGFVFRIAIKHILYYILYLPASKDARTDTQDSTTTSEITNDFALNIVVHGINVVQHMSYM